MNYNTQQKTLVLPEYGRNIQNMVDYAVSIQDRTERQRCAESIINIMGNLFPYLRDVNDFRHKLWDHLAIMSNFQLDIDYPCEIMKKENLHTRPDTIPYKNGYIRYRYYGRTLEKMIEKLGDYEEEPGKEILTSLLANHMKKSFLTWNKEMVDDEKIFKDMQELSKGKVQIDQEFLKLRESKDILQRRNKNNNNNNNNDKRRNNR